MKQDREQADEQHAGARGMEASKQMNKKHVYETEQLASR
jgi:hypothetical protein